MERDESSSLSRAALIVSGKRSKGDSSKSPRVTKFNMRREVIFQGALTPYFDAHHRTDKGSPTFGATGQMGNAIPFGLLPQAGINP